MRNKNVSYKNIDITGGFWKDRQDLNKIVTIYAVRDRFKDTGRFDAFKCDWTEGKPKSHISSGTQMWQSGWRAPRTYSQRRETRSLKKG